MNALQWLKQFKHLPLSVERPCTPMSNSELKRLIKNGSVLFNAEKVEIDEEIDFPVHTITFFPKGKRKTTF